MDKIKQKDVDKIKKALQDRSVLVCRKLRDLVGSDTDSLISELSEYLVSQNIGDISEWKATLECAKRIISVPELIEGVRAEFLYKGEKVEDIARERDFYKAKCEGSRSES